MKNEIKLHFLEKIPKTTEILDVGAGCGTYSDLLRADFPLINAVEIFAPYIQTFNLIQKYNNVYVVDILRFNISPYDYIILGDIIEHLEVSDAKALLNKINDSGKRCLVGVPYNYEQGVHFDNKHEIHLQPDLTHDLFVERYPFMKLLFGNNEYGYFINY
jgi:hypothetical protein